MRLRLETRVQQALPTVWTGFNRSLFEHLNPPFPPVRVLRFDGCLPGDVVHIRLNFFLFRQDWVSQIIDQRSTPDEIYFIDQGTRLPFFLTAWHHCHRLLRTPTDAGPGQTLIVDEINFQTPFWLPAFLLYPILWAQFVYRRPIYRRIFGHP
ncbi:SRPBCC family protein [Spirosoma koreense]